MCLENMLVKLVDFLLFSAALAVSLPYVKYSIVFVSTLLQLIASCLISLGFMNTESSDMVFFTWVKMFLLVH